MMKLFVLLLAVTVNGASAALRGITSFEDYVTVANSCTGRANPLNCLDCVGRNGADKECNENSAHSVKYSCTEGQHFCCTDSDIKETDFDDKSKDGKSKYGMCKACAEDGEEVKMNMYKDNGEQVDDSELQYLCCSGEVSDVSSISGINAEGPPFGEISGVCSEIPGESIKLE